MEVTLQMLSVTLVVLGMFLSFGLIWAKRRARPAGGYRRAARHALGYGADDPELDPDNNQFTRPGAITVGEELCRRSGNSRKQQVATIYGKHTDERVDNALDDVEENQATAGTYKPSAGFLYQGSSDLEIGNDPETGGAQYVGLRFQNSPVPRGAQIMGASLMLTIDESFNELEECDVTTHDAMDCRRFNEWLTATIKMRRVGDAPEWLDPDSTDPDVIANRDCSRDPFSGVIDSVCYTNYDCDAISQWKPVKEYIDQHFPSGLESCDFFTNPNGQGGGTSTAATAEAASSAPTALPALTGPPGGVCAGSRRLTTTRGEARNHQSCRGSHDICSMSLARFIINPLQPKLQKLGQPKARFI